MPRKNVYSCKAVSVRDRSITSQMYLVEVTVVLELVNKSQRMKPKMRLSKMRTYTYTYVCVYTYSGSRASLLTIILVLNSLQISFKKKETIFNLYSNVTYFNYLFIIVI